MTESYFPRHGNSGPAPEVTREAAREQLRQIHRDLTVVDLLEAARDGAAAANQTKAHDAIAMLLLRLGVGWHP